MPSTKSVKCGACNESITKSQGSINCRICSHWLHASCAKISEKDLSAFKAIKSSAFICASCDSNLNDVGDNVCVANEICKLNKKFDNFILNNQLEQSSIKVALDSIKSEVSSCLSVMKADIAQCNERINDVQSATSSKIFALEAENNVLHRRLNRADFLIGGLPEGMHDLVSPVVALGQFYKVPITCQDINQVCYINNRKQILVKLNNVCSRDGIMREYF